MNFDTTGGAMALRRAALHLHAMQPADRDWLLRNLAPQRRARLEVLLRELHTLGIPCDMELPHQEETTARREEGPSVTVAAERLALMPAGTVDWLAARLHAEPPEVTALLLSGRQWPWRQALLERLDGARRQCVEAWTHTQGSAPAQAAVIDALAGMLPTPAPVRAQNRRTFHWWRSK
ncbi:hypothetical protein LZ009_19405 [Ramlibacter sp. XY19]|uniref:hypothetical protein n=1 Tax=Ramlibacter paludis TaxID=2908000 RepID=UPI0023DB6300|nr:hypothetical protein [Ramlibacter paludis]MCG2594951.1 hypothetical protein [Ramlibacter paludis]